MPNLSEYSYFSLKMIWEDFWLGKDIFPRFREKPEGMTGSTWVYLVYQELKARGVPPPLEAQILDQLSLEMKNEEDL